MRLIIRSGGQSGVDRAALDAAIAAGLPYTGWCPRGGWAEDFPTPPGLLARYPRLTETPAAAVEQRTEWNVRDGDATLILSRAASLAASSGTWLTKECAAQLRKPSFVANLLQADPHAVLAWLRQLTTGPTDARLFDVNVAGPRESAAPGIYADARVFLAAVFRLVP